jgi:hypothetical protein
MMTDDLDPFKSWSIVELFGHRRIAGLVTADSPLMSATRLRIDVYVPGGDDPALTQFVPYPAAVYCLTPTTEVIARAIGGRALAQQPPVARWELPAPAPAAPDGDDDVVDAVIHAYGCDGEDCDGECDG